MYICNLISALASSISDGSQPLWIKWMQNKLKLRGGVIAIIFVCLFRSAKFLMCLRPVLDSFLLMSFAPPQMTTKSLRCRWHISRRAKSVICPNLEPGITAPITSKLVPSEAKGSVTQPLAWLSPMIKFLFQCGFVMHLFLIFPVAVFSTKPENERLLILLGGYLVTWNDLQLSVLVVVVVHLAGCCISVRYSSLLSRCPTYSSQYHGLEHSNHMWRFYLVCLQWCSVQ